MLHPVSDLARPKPVYAALLGVTPDADSAYYVGFEATGQHIGLVAGGGPQDMSSSVAYWQAADIEAKLTEVTAAGASVNQGARAQRRRRTPGNRHRPRRQRPRLDPRPLMPSPTLTKAAAMTSIQSLTLEVSNPTAATAFYTAAFDLGDRLDLRASEVPTSGFRGCTLSLVVSQPATVDGLIGAALKAGAMPLKPVKKSLWGYGGVIQAPDGTIWKVATSSKKDTGPATRQIDEIVVLLGAEDVAESKRFYVDHGLEVDKSFGRKYVQFANQGIKLALYGRRALAKNAGVSPDGTGSHRIVIGSDAGPFTDPDGFAWKPADEAPRPAFATAASAIAQAHLIRIHPAAASSRPAIANITKTPMRRSR